MEKIEDRKEGEGQSRRGKPAVKFSAGSRHDPQAR